MVITSSFVSSIPTLAVPLAPLLVVLIAASPGLFQR
jgi:hypothetical protein